MHIGSGTDLEHLSEVCDAMEKAAISVGRTIKTIVAGGGLPVPYKDDETYVDLDKYFELWATRNRLSERFGHRVSLEIEPGRFLAAESGFLIAEVRSVKQQETTLPWWMLDSPISHAQSCTGPTTRSLLPQNQETPRTANSFK